MSLKGTVYAASSGSYSDYRVECLFDRKEDAEAHVARCGGDLGFDAGFVEEFVVYGPGGPDTATGHRAHGFKGSMLVSVGEEALTEEDSEWPVPVRPRTKESYRNGSQTIEALCADRAAAIKAVKDRLAAVKDRGDAFDLEAVPPMRVARGQRFRLPDDDATYVVQVVDGNQFCAAPHRGLFG